MQEYRVIAYTIEMYKWQFSPVDSSLPFALTDCPGTYCAAQTQFELGSRLLQQNKATIVTCVAPHTARAIHLASPHINKKRNGRKLYSSHAWSYERRELSMSKFSLWITYSTCKKTCFGHYSSLPAANFQPTATQGMYNFRFTILINTNNTSNY